MISEIAAEYTLALISGQGTPNFGVVTGAVLDRSPVGSIFGAGRTTFGGGPAANDNGTGITVTRGGGFNFGNSVMPGDQPTVAVPGAGAPSLLDKAGIAMAATAAAQLIGGGGGTMGSVLSMGGSIGGQALGAAMSGAGGALSFLGAAGGPVDAIAGAILGSVLGGAFSSTKRGSAIIGGNAGQLGIMGFYGNSANRKDAAAGSADSLIDMINRLAGAVGGDVNSAISPVSIGQREGNWRVDALGRGYEQDGEAEFSERYSGWKAAYMSLLHEAMMMPAPDMRAYNWKHERMRVGGRHRDWDDMIDADCQRICGIAA